MTELLREYLRTLIEREMQPGCRYERLVIKTLRSAGVGGNIKSANCNASFAPDADMKLGDEIFYVEVKANADARMGTAPVRYSYADKSFTATGMNMEFSELIVSMLNEMPDSKLVSALDRLIRFLKGTAISPRRVSSGFPIRGFTPQAWAKAKQLGLIAAVNQKLDGDVSIITRHYAQKGVHYIQIGEWGLYHMGENPAGLPVPQLDGFVELQMYASKSDTSPGSKTSMTRLRVFPHLKPSLVSDYSLDDPDSITAMLSSLEYGDHVQPDSVVSTDGVQSVAGPGVPEDAHVRAARG